VQGNNLKLYYKTTVHLDVSKAKVKNQEIHHFWSSGGGVLSAA
jgi:hypothetical protein